MHVAADPRGNINNLFSYWAHMCTPWPWREMRAIAYGNNGVTMTPAARLKPLVLILDGLPDEKRPFENGEEIVATMRQELPGVDVERSLISSLSGVPTSKWTRSCANACACLSKHVWSNTHVRRTVLLFVFPGWPTCRDSQPGWLARSRTGQPTRTCRD